ncbi:PadR family transcriptional regulator [Pelagibacterium luteolum]|uniref:DNA-binding transcriptional regulator, PadR family n=1 Tax=Pelagibacterium luteolum TaxID=440168 RepID=A0A1G7TE83_9HYPH|nr:PadR family transcriptional regulator [Pelagibacterium luteolum]SDG33657.1 DNA-binding transcriptional regulator, PadR family [Pelagibacterium luteolum]
MNVRTLCLSFLYERNASGYEIRKLCTEAEGAYFVEASFGSIYPALSRLEDDGLVTSTVEHQSGKPSKKIYAITEMGRAAFIDALHEPLGEDVFRSPFLLFARFAHLVDADLVRIRVMARLEGMDKEIAELRRIQTEMDEGVTQSSDASHANDAWVLSYGLSCLEVARRHLHTHMNELIASARQNRATQQAAE